MNAVSPPLRASLVNGIPTCRTRPPPAQRRWPAANGRPPYRRRYGALLFVEKEGFDALLARAQIAERFDLAIMSTKGMSNVASRRLVDELSRAGITVHVLHDFDKSGFSIFHSVRSDARRYTFTERPRVVNLGLSLADVREMGLQSELVEYDKKTQKDPRLNLRESGATEEEANFLVTGRQYGQSGRWVGQRVELNAMDSAQFVAFLEQKLTAAGVRKIVPPCIVH